MSEEQRRDGERRGTSCVTEAAAHQKRFSLIQLPVSCTQRTNRRFKICFETIFGLLVDFKGKLDLFGHFNRVAHVGSMGLIE